MATATTSRKNASTNRLNGNGNHNGNGRQAAQNGDGKPCAAEIEVLVGRMEKLAAEAKERYAAADAIEQQVIAILAHGKTGLDALAAFGAGQTEAVTLSNGRIVRLTSKFFSADGSVKSKAYGLSGIQAIEVVVK